jgi:hypothetical protein
MSDWEFVKERTAADGAVWRSADGSLYKRTGDAELGAEADFQRMVAGLGYPVPEIVEAGNENGHYFVIERAIGDTSLHDAALADAKHGGQVGGQVVHMAANVAARLLQAQAAHPLPLTSWFERAAFAAEVFEENPDLDTARVHDAVKRALDRMDDLPMVRGHLDYGLPNVLEAGIIDWQHHGSVPLGYDVYPALDIVAFKGGGKGYTISPEQRTAYTAALDAATVPLVGQRVSGFLGDFLFVKCFFFLALMRPSNPARHDKHVKWQYRRALFMMGLELYESTTTIDTGTFPTLAEFTAEYG